MINKIIFVFLLSFLVECTCVAQEFSTQILTGAEQMDEYLPLLRNKNVALLVNQTSVVKQTHLVDTLLAEGIRIQKIFAPEHGFRGTNDAGEKIKDGMDVKTQIQITSLYGEHKKPSSESLQGIDIVLFDIQDVGARFYTYISSLQYMMEACAEYNIPLLILDRPNPNGFYVDGPVLEPTYTSFVGMQSIPIVHGMTVAEYAKMLNEEKLLKNKLMCSLYITPCKYYNHSMLYAPPIPPSPNLQTLSAILLYPSLCLFEGTDVSVGRGTETPFEVWGHPSFSIKSFAFQPKSMAGAKSPPHQNKTCFGANLHQEPQVLIKALNKKIQLKYLQEAYSLSKDKEHFFTPFFQKLVGNSTLQLQIKQGKQEKEIRQSWEKKLTAFKKIRKKYLLYTDFE